MKTCITTTLLACLFSGLTSAADLDALIQEYNKAKSQVARGGRGPGGGGPGGRGGGWGGGGNSSALNNAELILDEIGKLHTDLALKFLLDEVEKASPELATLSARSILTSGHPMAAKLLFKDFGAKPAKVCHAILDAVTPAEPAAEGGRGGRWPGGPPGAPGGAQAQRDPVDVEWKTISRELHAAARTTKDAAVKRRLVQVLAKLEPLDASKAIVEAAASQAKPDPGEARLREAAVKALVEVAEADEAKAWLEDKAFAFAKSNAGMLAVVAETTGRLGLASARPRIEDLLSHRTDTVAAAAVDALARMPGDLTEGSVKALRQLLKRSHPVAVTAEILDTLATCAHPEAIQVVLECAETGDTAARSIAMGSLGRAKEKKKVLRVLLSGLQDKAADVRANAVRALAPVREKEMIPALVDLLGRETVERPKAEAHKLLVELTGQDMGLAAEDWRSWWESAEASFSFRDAGKARKTKAAASFFGIKVDSKRIAFLIDVSTGLERGGPGGPGGPWGPGRGGGGGWGGGGGEDKLTVLRKELTRVLKELSDDVLVNVIPFDQTVRSWSNTLVPLGGGGRDKAIAFVLGLTGGRGSNLMEGIESALLDRRVDTICLLGDGPPTAGPATEADDILRAVVELNRIRGVTIHCVSFSEESKLLQKLAEDNGGVYRARRSEEERRNPFGKERGPGPKGLESVKVTSSFPRSS